MPKAKLTGTLRGGIVGPSGETTGHVLENVVIEIDVEDVKNAADLLDKKIEAEGDFIVQPWITRGPTWIFKADSAEEA